MILKFQLGSGGNKIRVPSFMLSLSLSFIISIIFHAFPLDGIETIRDD